MGKSSNLILFLWILILLSACSNKEERQKPISLEPANGISELNDSTFIYNLDTIKFANNQLFISLYLTDNLPHILQIGSDFNLLGRISKTGKGPGEFTVIKDMSIVNDSLYLYDNSQAKMLVYDNNLNFVREARVPEASGSDMIVDDHSSIFLSTPNRKAPITKLNANGKEVTAFGNKTVIKDNRHFRRNSRFLFIHNDRLIAIGRSEPVLEVYSLDGKFISNANITPPAIHKSIERVKEENQGPNANGFSNLFWDAAIKNDNLYLMEAKSTGENSNTYDTKFTYLFKYKLEPNGELTHQRTFKLFRSDRDKLMYGLRLAVVDDHKLVVYDMMGESLLVYEDEGI